MNTSVFKSSIFYVPERILPKGGIACPGTDNNCNGRGKCDTSSGKCLCFETFFGPACQCM